MVIRTMQRLLRCHKRAVFYNILLCMGGGKIEHYIIFAFSHLRIYSNSAAKLQLFFDISKFFIVFGKKISFFPSRCTKVQ